MKIKLFCLISFLTAVCAVPGWALFIDGLEDVPIMEGLTQVQKDNITFGNEESRLVEVYLSSKKHNYKNVSQFYTTTLPQMGWSYQGQRESTLVFEREGEVLEINKETVRPLLIRLTVKSKI